MSSSNCDVEFKEFDGKKITASGNFKLDVPDNKIRYYKSSKKHASGGKSFGNNQRHIQVHNSPAANTERWSTNKGRRGSWKSKFYHRKPWWKKHGRNYWRRFKSNSGSPNSQKAKPAQKKSKIKAKICRSIYTTKDGTTIKRFSDTKEYHQTLI